MLCKIVISVTFVRSLLTSISYDEIMDVMVSVRVSGLQSEHRSVWRSVELYHSLHWQWSIDETRRFVVDVFDMNDDPLVVSVCSNEK